MPPRWLDHFSDRLMPGNPKRRIRPVQTWIAILTTLSSQRAMQFITWTGLLPGSHSSMASNNAPAKPR